MALKYFNTFTAQYVPTAHCGVHGASVQRAAVFSDSHTSYWRLVVSKNVDATRRLKRPGASCTIVRASDEDVLVAVPFETFGCHLILIARDKD